MNISKVKEHFKWKLQNSWKPTKKDIEAFNSLIEYVDYQETKNLNKNESLAKLFIHQLILLNESKSYSGERAIQVIDEILEHSVYDWCVKLQNNIGLMNFNTINDSNTTSDKDKALHDALIMQPKEEHIIKFVESQITRIINKYEK